MKAWVLIVLFTPGGEAVTGGYAIDSLPTLEACQELADIKLGGTKYCFEYDRPHIEGEGK